MRARGWVRGSLEGGLGAEDDAVGIDYAPYPWDSDDDLACLEWTREATADALRWTTHLDVMVNMAVWSIQSRSRGWRHSDPNEPPVGTSTAAAETVKLLFNHNAAKVSGGRVFDGCGLRRRMLCMLFVVD
jgi:hypothetical protein